MAERLTEKQKKFCEFYILGEQPVEEAIVLAGYVFKAKKKLDNKINKRHAIKRVLSSLAVKEYINELKTGMDDAEEVERSYVIRNLKAMAEKGETDSTRLKAMELLGKTLGMFSDKQIIDDRSSPAELAKETFFKERKLKLVKKEEEEDDGRGDNFKEDSY